jgi:hypothetical protein
MEVIAQFHVPTALHLGKEPQIPMGYVAAWTHDPVRTLGRKSGIEPEFLGHPTRSLVTIPTELPSLHMDVKSVITLKIYKLNSNLNY